MSGYFSYFPKIAYNLEDSNANEGQLATNILQRSAFLKEIANNTAIFYKYQVKETDTPEIIADKLYGSPTRHWIVLLFNQIQNPYYQFPLSRDALETYITKKYDQTLAQSQSTIHHYEQVVVRSFLPNTARVPQVTTDTYRISEYEVNYTTGAITARSSLPGTADTETTFLTETVTFASGTLTTKYTNKAVSNYTYELEENEKKREIKLLDSAYIAQVEREFGKLMQNV